jgi:hypothetical protein
MDFMKNTLAQKGLADKLALEALWLPNHENEKMDKFISWMLALRSLPVSLPLDLSR